MGDATLDWPQILAQHDRWLRTVVYARLGSGQAVDEVLQEVALAAVEQRSPLEDPAKVAPWLYRLAVTQALLYRRRQGRSRGLIERFATRFRPSEVDHRTTDPLEWLVARERGELIRQSLEALPRRDREVLLLKYTENWSYRELSDHLGISPSAVEARLHRARTRMRQELAKLDVVEIAR